MGVGVKEMTGSCASWKIHELPRPIHLWQCCWLKLPQPVQQNLYVIPAKAGIQLFQDLQDPRALGDDVLEQSTNP